MGIPNASVHESTSVAIAFHDFSLEGKGDLIFWIIQKIPNPLKQPKSSNFKTYFS
jgi:hypothetical protein